MALLLNMQMPVTGVVTLISLMVFRLTVMIRCCSGKEYYRKWDEDNYKTAKYTIKFQLGTDDGRPTIEGIDVTGGLNDGSDWDWGMETYYKVLR